MINNFSKIEKRFFKETGRSLVKSSLSLKNNSESVSVIIPLYNNLEIFKNCYLSLLNQRPKRILQKITEIIIIDDGSKNSSEIKRFLSKSQGTFTTILLTLKHNYGRSIARNIGILHARNEVLIFLDADMVVSNDFIRNHLARHILKKIMIVGMRENIKPSKLELNFEAILEQKAYPNFKKDFRWEKKVPLEWKRIYTKKKRNVFNKTYNLIIQSDFFKKFTLKNSIGVWELPMMFLTSNASVKRRDAIRVGGFDLRFCGWGFEDSHFAYKLLKQGTYLIPCLRLTAYHQKENREQNFLVFKKNYELFQSLKKEDNIIWSENHWKNKIIDKYKTSYTKHVFPLHH